MRTLVARALGPAPPLYQAVGLAQETPPIRLSLKLANREIDVSGTVVPAALRPFTLAFVLPLELAVGEQLVRDPRAELHLVDEEGARLGALRLRFHRRRALGPHDLHLASTVGRRDYCSTRRQRWALGLRQWLARRRTAGGQGFQMVPRELKDLFVFYFRPRPVFLVSIGHGERSNVFPMDLVGSTGSPYYLLALRATSPSIPLISEARRVALAGVPLEHTETAYTLGRHHRLAAIDWSLLPFDVTPSPTFGLPRMEPAVTLRELEVESWEDVGSHRLFIARTVTRERLRSTLQMSHVHGFEQMRRRRLGRAYPEP